MNPLVLALLVAAVVAIVWWLRRRSNSRLAPGALRVALSSGVGVLIDVREPAEWARGTIRQAARLPLSDLRGARRQWAPFLQAHRHRQLFIYCQSGMRSGMAAALLRREGFDAHNAGSISTLRRAGLAASPDAV